MYNTHFNQNNIEDIEQSPTKKTKKNRINKKTMSLKVILTTIVSHLSYPYPYIPGRIKFTSAFVTSNLIYGSKYKRHAISKSNELLLFTSCMKKNDCSNQRRKVHLGSAFTSYFKKPFQPFGSSALYSTKSALEENDDTKNEKKTRKPKSKKIKINPNWKKEYDKDALTAAFDEMARKDGFDDSMDVFADDETFEDNFDYDNLDEFESLDDDDVDDDDDDDYLDFGSDFDDDNENTSDSSGTNLQSKESMASRIAAAKRDIDLGKVTVPDDIDEFAKTATQNDLRKIGFRREENPYGYDETPRRDAFKLVTDATICSACGSPFQSKDESKPGYLPTDKYEIQLKLAKIEEMQKLKEKAEAFEWSAEDEIEWLIQTSGNDDIDSNNSQDGASVADIDITGMAEELGLDLAELSKKKTICKRCHGLQNFGTVDEQLRPGHTDEPLLSQEAFRNLLSPIKEKKAVIIALIDLFDFSGSVLPELDAIAGENPVLLAANKADLLPSKMGQTRAENWVRRELEYLGVQSLANIGGAVRLVSCKTGFGLSALMTKARELAEDMDCDIYIVGAANAGKSTMINHILEKNAEKKQRYGKKRPGNTNARKGGVTASPLPGTTLKFIKVDIGGSKSLYDTPGLLVPGTLTQLLTPEELKMVVPKK